ncbi:MAG: GNAT family N-acetyltransferase [Gammaproteobacteria bacterium]
MNPEEIYIRQFKDCDLLGLTELLNNSENQELVGGSLEPMSEDEVLNWLNLKNSDEGTNIFAIICKDEFAGYVMITSIDRINGHAVFGINISRLFQGKGVGAIAMRYVHGFCKDNLSLRKLVLYVREDNQRAISLYKRLGYKSVGSLLNHIKVNESYIANNVMEVFL